MDDNLELPLAPVDPPGFQIRFAPRATDTVGTIQMPSHARNAVHSVAITVG